MGDKKLVKKSICPESGREMEETKTEIEMGDCFESDLKTGRRMKKDR